MPEFVTWAYAHWNTLPGSGQGFYRRKWTLRFLPARLAGTRFPPSYCASLRAAGIAAMIPMTRLRPFVHPGILA